MKPNRLKNDTVTAPLAALNRMLRNSGGEAVDATHPAPTAGISVGSQATAH